MNMNINIDPKGKSQPSLQREIVKQVAKADLGKKLSKPKTGLGRVIRNMKVAKFEKAKLNTLKGISRRQQGVVGRMADAGKELGTALIASETAKDLTNKNSYRTSLAAWQKNITGNPDPSTGEEGTSQGGSTSELGG